MHTGENNPLPQTLSWTVLSQLGWWGGGGGRALPRNSFQKKAQRPSKGYSEMLSFTCCSSLSGRGYSGYATHPGKAHGPQERMVLTRYLRQGRGTSVRSAVGREAGLGWGEGELEECRGGPA